MSGWLERVLGMDSATQGRAPAALAPGARLWVGRGVALSDVCDMGAYPGHDASPLVAPDHREWHRDVAGDQMLVGVAQAAGGELDQSLVTGAEVRRCGGGLVGDIGNHSTRNKLAAFAVSVNAPRLLIVIVIVI